MSPHLPTSIQFGSALIYLAAESNNVDTRRAGIALLQSITFHFPHIAGWIIRDSLLHRLSREELSRKNDNIHEEIEENVTLQSRFYVLLSACASLPEGLDPSLREQELAETLILAHHSAICASLMLICNCRISTNKNAGGNSSSAWIDLCQKARVDPHHLITHRMNRLMQLIWESVDTAKMVQLRYHIAVVVLNFSFIYSHPHLSLRGTGLSRL